MEIESTPQLVSALRDGALLTPVQLELVTRTLASRHRDPRGLGQLLVERGWLTAFQLGRVMGGRGRTLSLGPYLLLDRVGAGGMGEVFKACHRRLRRVVALKVMLRRPDDDPSALPRFLREADAASRLSHPNIVAVHDAGEEGDRHYLAMEFIDGIDLGRLVHQAGPLPVGLACDFARQAALGLHHAHELGYIHRDVKPQNLLVGPRPDGGPAPFDRFAGGTVKVLDMGLVRSHHAAAGADPLTARGAMLGTIDYMSPEQANDASAVDRRADLYSLGCTLYHLLTGRPPFPGGLPLDKILRHQTETPPPLRDARPGVPPALDAVVARLMAKRREHRFATAAEAADALAPFAAEVPDTDPGTGPVPGERSAATTLTLPLGSKLPPTRVVGPDPAGRRWPAAVGSAAVLALAAVAALWIAALAPRPTPPNERPASFYPADVAGVIEFRPGE
ncbi:MAG: serine/threonine-protein kinase, partial [Gemmataceae bacterium]